MIHDLSRHVAGEGVSAPLNELDSHLQATWPASRACRLQGSAAPGRAVGAHRFPCLLVQSLDNVAEKPPAEVLDLLVARQALEEVDAGGVLSHPALPCS